MNTDPVSYYSERAREYDSIYQKPERQDDLKKLSVMLKDTFSGRQVFEMACGTGYWTQIISEAASYILATDINASVIEVAKTKTYTGPVTFKIADIYELPPQDQTFNAAFGGFIWSHIPKERLSSFLSQLTGILPSGTTIVFVDNNYVESSSTPIAHADGQGNTYQIRKLANNSSYKILKNFPTDKELREVAEHVGNDINIQRLKYFWILTLQTRPA